MLLAINMGREDGDGVGGDGVGGDGVCGMEMGGGGVFQPLYFVIKDLV